METLGKLPHATQVGIVITQHTVRLKDPAKVVDRRS